MKNSINQKLPFTVFLFSILCAFFLDIKPVNWALVYGGFWKTETGVMNTLFPITIGIIVILGFIRNGVATFAKNTKGWFLILFLIIYYLFSTRFICPSHTTITLFMGFTIGGLIIPLLSRVDVCVLLKAIMIFPAFSILRTDLVFEEQLGSISMDASYGFIIPISACIVYYFNGLSIAFWFKRPAFWLNMFDCVSVCCKISRRCWTSIEKIKMDSSFICWLSVNCLYWTIDERFQQSTFWLWYKFVFC